MKKRIIVIAITVLVIAACSGGSSSNSNENNDGAKKETKQPENDLSSNPDYQKGLALVGEKGCFACHKIDDELTGPSYKQVAEKYAGASQATVTELAGKIIKGGSGVWGETMMTPNPGVSQEEAEAMVKYILLLKK